MANVTMSTLPVRSPLPKSVPSDPIGAGQHGQLRRRDRSTPVVVRVQAEHDGVPVLDRAPEPLDHVRVHVRRVHLDGRRQVEDHRALGRRLNDVHDRLADLHGEFGLGPGEAFGRVLVADLGPLERGLVALAELRRGDGDVDDARLVEPEDDAPLQLGDRVVEVDHRPRCTHQRLERPLNQLLAALHQHLDLDVVRDEVLVDDQPLEVVVGLRRRGEPDLDLLEAHVDQRLEQRQLALGVHGVDQGLVAVAQVDAGPARARTNWRSGQVRSCSTSGTCERYLSKGIGEGSQGRARRARSATSPFPLASPCIPISLTGSSLGLLCCRPNKKPPGRSAQEVASERDVAFAVR